MSIRWWERFPHSQLDLGANPESAPEMAINSLPLAHIFSCSLTAMVITSHEVVGVVVGVRVVVGVGVVVRIGR